LIHEAQMWSTSNNESQGLTEIVVICTAAGEWEKQIHQPCGLTPLQQNHTQKAKTTVKMGDLEGLKY
jgi:hypothetical protein